MATAGEIRYCNPARREGRAPATCYGGIRKSPEGRPPNIQDLSCSVQTGGRSHSFAFCSSHFHSSPAAFPHTSDTAQRLPWQVSLLLSSLSLLPLSLPFLLFLLPLVPAVPLSLSPAPLSLLPLSRQFPLSQLPPLSLLSPSLLPSLSLLPLSPLPLSLLPPVPACFMVPAQMSPPQWRLP